ncbi:hypothetical protein EJD97_020207 [Solanum chilense]|uniref:Gag-pol polyprotein n=1 Tax=Solanum chilense TaxID=4083 RepID=A0A6N2B035_SOLCI|nr:hypothetical protein EJD97_020207 [Solanum chilense]
MAARRFEEERMNEEIPPQVEQVPQGGQDVQGVQGAQVPPQDDHVPNVEGYIEVPEMANVVESTMTSRLRDFARMNPPIFLVSKVGEDPQEFLDGVYRIFSAMRVTSKGKVELASYQLRDVSQIWYTQ